VRVVQCRCALYGLLIYRQGDRDGIFSGYDFYRNEVLLREEDQGAAAHSDAQEPKVPVVIYVDVLHPTDEAAPGVEDVALAEVALVRTRALILGQPGEVHGFSLLLSGKGALLTAPLTTVRSGAIRP